MYDRSEMKKIIFLMPVYNDWESLNKLLKEIDLIIDQIDNFEFSSVIINDCSTTKVPEIFKPKNFSNLKIINMKNNRGHARCNASGLRFINVKEEFDYVIVMDSDGEDRPIEIKDLIKKISNEPHTSVVAKRIKRSEGPIFQSLYQIHKFITYIFTGKNINFGNYSCLTKKDVGILSTKESLWSSFSGTLKKNLLNLNEINSVRGLRYFGPSKMSFFNLAIHSLSIIAVFKNQVFFRSALAIFFLYFLKDSFDFLSLPLQTIILIFNLLIFVVSRRENKEQFLKSNENISNEIKLTH